MTSIEPESTYEERVLLLGGGQKTKAPEHQTTAFALSELRDYTSRPDHRISKDAPIRYPAPAPGQFDADGPREFLHLSEQPPVFIMRSWRTASFFIGVIYSNVALAIAAGSLGYEVEVENQGYGFRALLNGTAVLSIVTFISSLGLTYGVIEGDSRFVSAWLVMQVVVPLYTAAFYFWGIFAAGSKTMFGAVETAVPYVSMVAAVHILTVIGCTVIVNKFYSYLKIRDSLKKHEDM